MDENKEFLTSENTEEIVEFQTTDVEDTVQEDSASVFVDELAEIGEDAVFSEENNEDNLQTKKKNHFIQVPIIISLIIVVGVALGFLVFKCFFNTSIVGAWAIEDITESEATADEASSSKVYYVFEDDGVLSLSYGTVKYVGSYTLSGNEVTMDITSANLYATFEFSVTGNVFTGRTLTLENSTYDAEYTFHSAKVKVPKLKVDDDFKPNDKLTGEWNFYNGIYDYVYDFKSDGTVSINQNEMLFIEGVYNCTDDIITIRFYADSEQRTELKYEVDDDSLIIDGLQYLRVGSASADEAREALSDLAW